MNIMSLTPEDKAAADKAAAEKKAAEDKAAADKLSASLKVAAEKTAAEKAAETEKARAVAAAQAAQREADKKAIDDAAAAKKAAPVPFTFSGTVGHAFAIYGQNLGSEGTLLIGDRPVTATKWTQTNIKGVVPSDLEPGKVVVKVNDKSVDAVI
jgi:hypothetical protein